MQPTRNTPSENTPVQSVEFPSKQWEAALTKPRNCDDDSEMPRATPRVSDVASTPASTCRAASELHERIEIWLNEGGVEGSPMKVLRVLLVEDDAIIAMLLADMFAALGHDVCAIEATEAGAVAAAFRCRPDLIIVDARLGDESGVSAMEEILSFGFVPHVFISGDILTIRALRPDAVAIQKPFDESDLVRAIQRTLSAAVAS